METFTVDDKNFTVINYGDLTLEREDEINQLLGIVPGTDSQLVATFRPEKLLPKILVPIGDSTPEVNWRNVHFKELQNILAAFLVERQRFLASMGENLSNLVLLKMSAAQN